jgi:phage-related protein (TIGR01555 family)
MTIPGLDAFSNVLARLGFGTPNLLEGTEYPLTRLTRNYNLMNSLYRSHWIVRKIIDTIPEDMCKNWYELQGQVTPEAIDLFNKVERKTRTKVSILKGLKWGRLYGGAAGVILVEGHENYLSDPLDLDSIMPGSYKGLMVLDRWSGVTPTSELIEDINDPDFGLPASYQITTETSKTIKIHASRVLRFTGRDLPFWEKLAEMHWGISEIEVIYDELKKRDNTSWNIASLIFMANLRVLKMGDLGEMLSTGSAQLQQKLYNTLAAQNHILSNMGLQILGRDDDFDTKQITGFNGLSSMYECFMMDIAGACEIPVTRLFGRSPAGLNATGESDDQNYEGVIEQKQEASLRPVLEKLLPVMCMSTWGQVPDDLDFTFNPYRTLDNKEMADLAKAKSDAIVEVYNALPISDRTALKELRQMSDETGMWSNITDEDIEAASDVPAPKGEMFGMGGGLPEFQSSPVTDAEWNEGDHSREEDGKFKGSGTGSHRREIIGLYEYALSGKSNEQKKVIYGKVGRIEADKLKDDTGLNVEGYSRIIDNYAIKHINREHRDERSESSRGQKAVGADDIARIPEIITDYDRAEKITTKLGKDGIGYWKRINGTIYYVEELRTGQKELAAVSLRIMKARQTND